MWFTLVSHLFRELTSPVSAAVSISVVHETYATTCYLLWTSQEKHLAVVGILCVKYA